MKITLFITSTPTHHFYINSLKSSTSTSSLHVVKITRESRGRQNRQKTRFLALFRPSQKTLFFGSFRRHQISSCSSTSSTSSKNASYKKISVFSVFQKLKKIFQFWKKLKTFFQKWKTIIDNSTIIIGRDRLRTQLFKKWRGFWSSPYRIPQEWP